MLKKRKKCASCGKLFLPAIQATGRNRARCKKCNADAAKIYRRRYRRKIKLMERKRYRSEARSQKSKVWGRKSKLSKFGLNQESYEIILESQNGVCAICKKPEQSVSSKLTFKGERKTKNLAVDHCHKTRYVRGLLCSKCNSALGQFNDDVGLLINAITYLELHNTAIARKRRA